MKGKESGEKRVKPAERVKSKPKDSLVVGRWSLVVR